MIYFYIALVLGGLGATWFLWWLLRYATANRILFPKMKIYLTPMPKGHSSHFFRDLEERTFEDFQPDEMKEEATRMAEEAMRKYGPN